MKSRPLVAVAVAAVATSVLGFAFAQQPQPAPAKPAPAALSDELPVPPPPKITAKAWLLMDFATGQVLAGENEDERVEPASITKVMTSYVVAAEMKSGKVKPTDQVMMSEHAWREGGAGTEGSYSGFEVNKTAPLVEMEKGMVVQSGNDAAIALAEHVAGSEDAFASLMNAYAKRIGLKNSHWVNPHGLSAPGGSTRVRLGITKRARELAVEAHVRRFGVQPYTAELSVATTREQPAIVDAARDRIDATVGTARIGAERTGRPALVRAVRQISADAGAAGVAPAARDLS